jgi:hypothetical protein
MERTLVSSFVAVPKRIVKDARIEDLFPGFSRTAVNADAVLRDFIYAGKGILGQRKPFVCMVFRTDGGKLSALFVEGTRPVDATDVWSVFFHLGSGEWNLLSIPQGSERMNILIGYALIGTKHYLIGIEHELERGEEKVHLRAWEYDYVENGPMLVLQIA